MCARARSRSSCKPLASARCVLDAGRVRRGLDRRRRTELVGVCGQRARLLVLQPAGSHSPGTVRERGRAPRATSSRSRRAPASFDRRFRPQRFQTGTRTSGLRVAESPHARCLPALSARSPQRAERRSPPQPSRDRRVNALTSAGPGEPPQPCRLSANRWGNLSLGVCDCARARLLAHDRLATLTLHNRTSIFEPTYASRGRRRPSRRRCLSSIRSGRRLRRR